MKKTESAVFCGLGCGFVVFILSLYCSTSWFCFDYCLWNVFGKDIPWYLDILCGIVLGEFIIPATVVVFILKIAGLAIPFFTL